ncbi:MAG: UvrD-helicase domain-containing protein [Clostridia bacterium]|nr:UvrD-helicase domain-containing protein [Clostridia bacterium]
MDSRKYKDEILYLEKTVDALNAEIEKSSNFVEHQKEEVLELKKSYLKHRREYDMFEFYQNYMHSDEIVDLANEQLKRLFRLRNVVGKPYFGRIDFVVEGQTEPVKLYIGLVSIEHNDNIYVIDWRAPVGELFYEAGKGKASYQAPAGVVEGEVVLKRQYDIENSQLKEVYDVDLNIFDEFLQKVLSKARGQKLHNIASTIQAEQNKIIRNLKDSAVVVQGCAGSGKTTVALHRVAYALYRLKNIQSANVLIFSPNEAFLSHISGVLPELGEENTRSATFPKFIKRFLKTDLNVESADEFTIRYLQLNKQEQAKIDCKLKFSIREELKTWLLNVNEELKFNVGFKISGREYGQHKLNQMLNETKGQKIYYRFNNLLETICKELGVKTKDDEFTIKAVLEKRLNHNVTIYGLLNEFLKQKNLPLLSETQINFDDAVLLCVLKEMWEDINIKMDVKHIVLDEAQDYPLVFIDFLTRAFRHANFSVFGDIFQKTVPGELNSLEDICNLEHKKGFSSYVTMDKSYRSSEEIVEYSAKLVGADKHNAFRLKTGNEVEVLKIGNNYAQISQQILKILEKIVPEDGNIGIITGDNESAQKLYDELYKVIPYRIEIVRNANSVVSSQVQIMSIALAKGLEFTTAIVVEKGLLLSENLNNFKYIACTRAINKLYVIK